MAGTTGTRRRTPAKAASSKGRAKAASAGGAEEAAVPDTRATGHEEPRTKRAAARKGDAQASAGAPEKKVVAHPPPKPDYPRYRVEPGHRLSLAKQDPGATEHYESKRDIKEDLATQRSRISDLQARLYAERRRSLLIVLQAMDTGGKDGTIRGVFAGVNPQGCVVTSFKQPSVDESDHDFLWRYHQRTPQRGMISIFNRSHYEDVLVVRVKKLIEEAAWRQRYHVINEWEHALSLSGVTIIKFFLHISRDEQKRRLESRLADPDKRWKFSVNDIREREHWDDYQQAFQDALSNTSAEHAPWYVVPSNVKWYRNLVIARTIADTLEAMDPRFPPAAEGLDDVTVPD